jgi:hypothetical protein
MAAQGVNVVSRDHAKRLPIPEDLFMRIVYHKPVACAVALVIITLMVTPEDASAYIDPGTGSFVVQGAIAAIVGAGVAMKLYWGRIKRKLGGQPSPAGGGDDDDDA